MPVNQSAMKAMKKEYGDKEGERVYYASVNAGKIKESTRRFAESLREAVKRAGGKR